MTEPGSPVLPGALGTGPRLGFVDRLRGKRLRMPWSLPDSVFHEPIVVRPSWIGDGVFIGDPALARYVLVENAADYPKAKLELGIFAALFGKGLFGIEGELWRTHRRIMAPAFDPRSVVAYVPTMSACVEELGTRWRGLEPGSVVDVADEMTALALSIIAQTMFSDEGRAIEPILLAALKGAPRFRDFNMLDFLPVVGPVRMRARRRRMQKVFGPLDREIGRMIAAREEAEHDTFDLLARLMASRDQTTGVGLDAGEVRDEVITTFMAGHETSATAMTWIWYLLAKHPAQQARLHEELDQVLAGRIPQAGDLAQLVFTRRLVEEALRLFPPVPGISARIAARADVVGGVRVRKGSFMIVLPWVLQRHRRTWDEPERFDPDRFLPERSKDRAKLATMPFGAGPRVCIGQAMAIHELVLIVAGLAQEFVLELAGAEPIELHHNITLRPRDGLRMRVRRRRPDTRAATAA